MGASVFVVLAVVAVPVGMESDTHAEWRALARDTIFSEAPAGFVGTSGVMLPSCTTLIGGASEVVKEYELDEALVEALDQLVGNLDGNWSVASQLDSGDRVPRESTMGC